MLKKSGLLAAGLLIMTSTLFADDGYYQKKPEKSTPEKIETYRYSGGFVTGFSLTTLETSAFGNNAGAVLDLGYYGPCWLIDIGVNIRANKEFDPFLTLILGHLGLRNRVYENLFVTYGVMAAGNIVSKGDEKQWTVGAFTGLDYQLSKHFMLSGKIYPYNYEHREKFRHNLFSNSTLSLYYVF